MRSTKVANSVGHLTELFAGESEPLKRRPVLRIDAQNLLAVTDDPLVVSGHEGDAAIVRQVLLGVRVAFLDTIQVLSRFVKALHRR